MNAKTASPCDFTQPLPMDLAERGDDCTIRWRADWERMMRYRVVRCSDWPSRKDCIGEWLRWADARALCARLDAEEGAEHPESIGKMTRTAFIPELHKPGPTSDCRADVGDLVAFRCVSEYKRLGNGTATWREYLRLGSVVTVGAYDVPVGVLGLDGEPVALRGKSWTFAAAELVLESVFAALATAVAERGHWGAEFSNVQRVADFLACHLRHGTPRVLDDPRHVPEGIKRTAAGSAAPARQVALFA